MKSNNLNKIVEIVKNTANVVGMQNDSVLKVVRLPTLLISEKNDKLDLVFHTVSEDSNQYTAELLMCLSTTYPDAITVCADSRMRRVKAEDGNGGEVGYSQFAVHKDEIDSKFDESDPDVLRCVVLIRCDDEGTVTMFHLPYTVDEDDKIVWEKQEKHNLPVGWEERTVETEDCPVIKDLKDFMTTENSARLLADDKCRQYDADDEQIMKAVRIALKLASAEHGYAFIDHSAV